MKKISLVLVIFCATLGAVHQIPSSSDTLSFFKNFSVNCANLRLHLGCGQTHLPDYINIDFPPSEHPLQSTSGADFFGDITQLSFPSKTVAEVRSHHTYEHFNRQTALALLAAWSYWLKKKGRLVIETPDFKESIKQLLDGNYSYQQKQVIMRHIFGSHEAFWANHYDGWYDEKFKHIIERFGFAIERIEQGSYLVIRNITIYATKKKNYSFNELRAIAHEILKESMVDNSVSEQALWKIWCDEFDRAYARLCLNK